MNHFWLMANILPRIRFFFRYGCFGWIGRAFMKHVRLTTSFECSKTKAKKEKRKEQRRARAKAINIKTFYTAKSSILTDNPCITCATIIFFSVDSLHDVRSLLISFWFFCGCGCGSGLTKARPCDLRLLMIVYIVFDGSGAFQLNAKMFQTQTKDKSKRN